MSQGNTNCSFTIRGDNNEIKTCSLAKMINIKTNTYMDFCYLHKPKNLCKSNPCLTKASFSGTDNIATYCAKHAPNNYSNIKRKKCAVQSCNIIPTFAYKESPTIKTHCYKHYLQNQIHVLKKCLNCRKDATHGIPNTEFKIFCKDHTSQEFVYIEKSKKNVKKAKKQTINENTEIKYSDEDEITIHSQNTSIQPTIKRKQKTRALATQERKAILEIDDIPEEGDGDLLEAVVPINPDNSPDDEIIIHSISEINQEPDILIIEKNDNEDLLIYHDEEIDTLQLRISKVNIH
jgi:hypothetical protein